MIGNIVNELNVATKSKNKLETEQLLDFAEQLYIKIQEPYPILAKKLNLELRSIKKCLKINYK